MESSRIAGLDGLRFLSIASVTLLHLFTFKSNFGYSNFYFPVFETIGGIYAVQFFFVVSGFLLTYLLLSERQESGRINVKAFYIRRILRIWPAYYLLIVVALLFATKVPYFRIPGITDAYLANHPGKSNFFFLVFLPHIAPYQNSTAPFVHHTYTIGIEEQFYLLWGMLFFFFGKNIIRALIAIILCMLLVNVVHEALYTYTSANAAVPSIIILTKKMLFYLKYSRISTFAIGALFGYAYFNKMKWIEFFKFKPVQLALYVILLFGIILDVRVPFFYYEYIGILIACLILIATFKEYSLVNFNNRWLSYLGKISYGVYLFHMFAIFFAIKLLKDIFKMPLNNFWQLLVLCITTIAISIFFGWLSYNFYEKYFLRLKRMLR